MTADSTTLPRVLVVDDEPDLRALIELMLAPRGFEVVTAAGGIDALHHLEGADRIDVMLLDERMPGMAGSEVLVALRSIAHRAALPVVCTSAFGEDGHTDRILALGAVAFLAKPFTMQQLIDTLHAALERGAPPAVP